MPARSTPSKPAAGGYLRSVMLLEERVQGTSRYPFALPAIAALRTALELHPHVTFLVGENGAGKSTLIEAIAAAVGLNAEGGGRNFRFATRSSESELHDCHGIREVAYEDTEHFRITRDFLLRRERVLRHLLDEG